MDYQEYYDKLGEHIESPDIRRFALSIDDVQDIVDSKNKKIVFTEFWKYSDDDLLDFNIHRTRQSFIYCITDNGDYYFDDYDELESDGFDVDDVQENIHIQDIYIQLCKDEMAYDEILEYIDEVPPSSKKVRKELYNWAKELEQENLDADELLGLERVNTEFHIHAEENIIVKIGEPVDARFQFDRGFVIFSIAGGGTYIQLKAHGLKKRIKELIENGSSVYDASAKGSDFDWWAPRARCISNISKDKAIELIKWSDYSFGVWCGEDRVPILLYPQEERNYD